jgi:hypothetical protein
MLWSKPMARKSKPKLDDPEQSKRFIGMAREVGAEQGSLDFERVLEKVAEKPKGHPKPSDRRSRRIEKRAS